MFSRMHKRLTYANIAMTVVLVFAMSGGALAASKYLITSTKQISPKVLKQLKGKAGPAGAAGATGAQGPQGPGGNGQNGTPGANGENVTAKAVPSKIAACKEQGGGEFTVGGGAPVLACNGEKGANGDSVTVKPLAAGEGGCEQGGGEFKVGSGTPVSACNGSPWTAGGTLPSKATEKGTWAIIGTAAKAGESFVYSISLPIPLKASIEEEDVGFFGFFGPTPTESTECPGGFPKPGAIPGHFCIFAKVVENLRLEVIENVQQAGEGGLSVGETGAMIGFTSEAAGPVRAKGTWAVTEK